MRGCEAAVEQLSGHATCSSCGTFPGVSGQRRIRSRSYTEHRSLRETFPWPRPALIPTAAWGAFAAFCICAVFRNIKPAAVAELVPFCV